MQRSSSSDLSKKVAFLGMMSAVAIALSFFEGLIPAVPFMLPGAKLGLSNIAVMYTLTAVNLPSALCVAVIKSLFVLLTRGLTSFFMSISGGLISAIVMYFLLKPKVKMGYVGVGIGGAVTHNTVQMLVSAVMTGTFSVVYYYPLLLIFAVVAGAVTGIVLKIIMPAINRIPFVPKSD